MTTTSLLKETALTLLTLRSVCASIGISKTGTKPVLVQRIRHAARNYQPLPPEARILSIDMGIRNFAFSLLTPVAPDPSQEQFKTTPLTTPVRLHVWKCLDLTLPALSHNTITSTKTCTLKDLDPADFSPAAMSRHAVDLVQSHLLPLRPTHVLIERQRFRSGGQAAVFEWTLRVNSLEAMLHALFASLYGKTLDGADGTEGGRFEGRVESVLPGGVVNYLYTDLAGKVDGQRIKKVKTDTVGRLLRDEGMVMPEPGQAEKMARLYVGQWERAGRKQGRAEKGVRGSGKGLAREVRNKLDDLADAVLQGMVWLQWQRNLEALIKERPELLEHVEGSELAE
ncbi:Ydc2-catalyt-domain-containing protein [Parathielavia appendiculata]|uniref:Ydc2-catalyt-domain-containing protein n=1 Tax=Parathielavia appendiculata TaxID=2587402 RepID=A0AAN6TXW9_9PEZI|nr:Ydc2-catalyt-domain-containing protein [Parathielavia appendiculata]